MRKLLFLFVALVSLGYMPVSAQMNGEFGIMAGGMYYIGDLNPAKHFLQTRPGVGLLYRHELSPRFSVRAQGIIGEVTANDFISKANVERGINFKSLLTEVGIVAEVNFFDYFIGSRQHFITPYLFGGAAVFFFNPKGYYNNTWYQLPTSHTEGPDVFYNLFDFVFPFGFGVKYSLNKKMGAHVEWGLRKTMTDYLDDVSTVYPIKKDFLSDPTGLNESGMQRGNSNTKDWYAFVNLGITFKIRMLKSDRCIEQQRNIIK